MRTIYLDDGRRRKRNKQVMIAMRMTGEIQKSPLPASELLLYFKADRVCVTLPKEMLFTHSKFQSFSYIHYRCLRLLLSLFLSPQFVLNDKEFPAVSELLVGHTALPLIYVFRYFLFIIKRSLGMDDGQWESEDRFFIEVKLLLYRHHFIYMNVKQDMPLCNKIQEDRYFNRET